MEEYKIQVQVNELDIEQFCLDFYNLPKENIDYIRDAIYDTINFAEDNPNLTCEPDFMAELSEAFAMRHALIRLNKLYDA